MQTTMNTRLVNTNSKSNTLAQFSAGKNTAFWNSVEFNRFGVIPILLVITGCLGGIAAAFGAGANVFRIALISFPTIISLAITLAVAPMRWIVWTSLIAIVLDVIVLVF